MIWDHLEVFCRVVENKSFTGAANAMNRPKSSVSAAVSELEQHLNVRLLQRTTRRLRTTDAGQELYQRAMPLFQSLREVAAEAAASGGAIAGTLRIAAPYEFGAHHLAAIACDLMTRFTGLRVNVDVEHAEVDLFGRRYDIVFSTVNRATQAASVVSRLIVSLERGLFAAPALLAPHPALDTPSDLMAMPLLATPLDEHWGFTSTTGSAFNVPISAPRMSSPNADIRLRAAIAGLGVARITKSFCTGAVQSGHLVPVLADYACDPLRIFALLPARRMVPAKVRMFLEALEAAHPGQIESAQKQR